MDTGRGVVVFGDVVESRLDSVAAGDWLRHLRSELDGMYADERLAPFGFTQGDELQGLLEPAADPLRGILVAFLDPAAKPMRWAVAEGRIDPGAGPATERTGEAFLRAREALEAASIRRDRLLIVTGEPGADRLLDGLAPLLGELLADLTPSQRIVARGLLVEGIRQADVAARLRVSRATISVAYARGRIRSIGRLADTIRAIVSAARLATTEGAAQGAG